MVGLQRMKAFLLVDNNMEQAAEPKDPDVYVSLNNATFAWTRHRVSRGIYNMCVCVCVHCVHMHFLYSRNDTQTFTKPFSFNP